MTKRVVLHGVSDLHAEELRFALEHIDDLPGWADDRDGGWRFERVTIEDDDDDENEGER